jgi:hypothetical protein
MAAGDVLCNCVRWRVTGFKDRFAFTENYFKGGQCPVEISHLQNRNHEQNYQIWFKAYGK